MKRLLIISGFVLTILPLCLVEAQTAWITNCPDQYSFSHCGISFIDFDGTGEGQLFFDLVSGPGQIDPSSGLWAWFGATVPQSGSDVIEVRVFDDNGPSASCAVDLTIINQPPTIECPTDPRTVWSGEPSFQVVSLADDCDDTEITIIDNGGVSGDISTRGDTLWFEPVADDTMLAQPVVFEVQVSDGEHTATCSMAWNILGYRPPSVSLEARPDQLQGQFTEVGVTLHSIDRAEGLAGFELLFAYDASVLSVPSAVEGEVYSECGWEYLVYRTVSNCGSGCPSGLLRVVGVANLNDGPSRPGCDSPDAGYVQKEMLPLTLVSLRFMVSSNRNLECQFVPIKFFWTDCGDNALANYDGSELHLSRKVFDYVDDENYPFLAGEITGTEEFPTYLGAQEECNPGGWAPGKEIRRLVDFQNGGIGIICADAIDARGDINQNHIAFEIADVIMLTNYFLIGLPAFDSHVEGSIAASDTNADGLPLTIADLVHIIRVVTGEVSPFLK